MKKQISILFSLSVLILLLVACNGEGLVKEKNRTLILGHRSTGVGVNGGFIENTLPAIQEALKYADGVESDIQMSSSKTLWIYHDDKFTNLCEKSKAFLLSNGYTCILQTPDSVIEKLRICRENVEDRIYKLEDLFLELSKHKDKIASLDIKGYFESSCVKKNNVDKEYQYDLADAIYALLQQYDVKDQIIAETNYALVFERLKEKDKSIQCHYMVYKNVTEKVDFAIKNGADGLTINIHDKSFNKEQIDLVRKNKLRFQLWTVGNKNDLKIALEYHPYAIQLSGLDLLREVKKSNYQKSKSQLYD